jgi:two-component system CAI-1 autoinducer sensor kinase/phosphatase CqsS
VDPRTNGRRTVLLVDDHEGLRAGIGCLLERAGYRVEVAGHGGQGIEQLRRLHVNLVVLDLDMPIMDGHAFLVVRARDAELARVPVLVYSANAPPTTLPVGVDAYVWKGADVADLLGAIERHSSPR